MRTSLRMHGRCIVDGKLGTVVGYGFACTTFNGEKDAALVLVQFDDGPERPCNRANVEAVPDNTNNTDAAAPSCPS